MSNGRDDLRLAVGWVDHVKTRRLIRDCGTDGAFCLLRLWSYAATNHPDGVLPEGLLEDAAGWTGEPGKLQAALLAHRWVEADGRTLHDWPEEQPYVYGRAAWLESKREAGRAGGIASAASRRDKYGTAQPATRSTPEAPASKHPKQPRTSVPSRTVPSHTEQSLLSAGADGVEGFVQTWNEIAPPKGLPSVRTLTQSRTKAIRAALKAEPDLAVWREAMGRLCSSPHHLGENDRGWKADMDFLLQTRQMPKWLDLARTPRAAECGAGGCSQPALTKQGAYWWCDEHKDPYHDEAYERSRANGKAAV